MRRSDREIQAFDEILDILNRCNTIRVGFSRDNLAYVVPLSFGYEVKDGKIVIYIIMDHNSEKKTRSLRKTKRLC
jgi:nitroimidazol reductase NimA-like FMN-containing flavoprotein (pyridoxamine 5'-phosphate oxidase superfamily)